MLINNCLASTQETITNLGWVSNYGGVSFPIRKEVGGSDTQKPLYKTFPVSETMVDANCLQTGRYKQLFPSNAYDNLLYWEVVSDLRPISKAHPKGAGFAGKARLVYWLNLPKMGIADNAQDGLIGVILANTLTDSYRPSDGMVMRLSKPTFAQKDARRIFPYDYDQSTQAFLLYPYGFGAIDFDVEIQITPACLPDLVQQSPIQCVTKW